jgi:uncharacterized protein YdeI (YjbR/CyaY-like superfamily)
MNTDPRVDAFIEKSADFAKPILLELRSMIHEAHPDIQETWKWSFPTFMYNNKIICSFSAFKKHCSFGFWMAAQLPDPNQILERIGKTSMGSLGKITQLADLPERTILISYIQTAIEISKNGTVSAKKVKPEQKWMKTSLDFQELFAEHDQQAVSFDALSDAKRKEYITWIEEAKTELTKTKRIQTMMDNLLENKSLHWKYNKK